MKYPKHITLDVSHTSISNTYKSSQARYDTTYKFNALNSTTSSNLTSVFSNWSSSKSEKSIVNANKNVNPLFLLYGLINEQPTQNFLEPNDRVELKLTKNLGLINEQPTQNLFNISFLRKEEIYTKLKYSRCPQYDMVSGGLAALFAAFLGFLICEKFGLELLDSGDFYIAFMYGVFATFSLRPLIRSMTKGTSVYNVISPKHLFNYLFILFSLLVNFRK